MKDPSYHRFQYFLSWFNDLDDLGVAMGNSILGNPQMVVDVTDHSPALFGW